MSEHVPDTSANTTDEAQRNVTQESMRRTSELAPRTFFLPLLLLMVAWLFWSGFQASQLMKERTRLTELHDNQEPTVRTAQQMRGQLDALAAGTKRLADAGHPQATLIVQELARRGVTINPTAEK